MSQFIKAGDQCINIDQIVNVRRIDDLGTEDTKPWVEIVFTTGYLCEIWGAEAAAFLRFLDDMAIDVTAEAAA